MKKAALANLVVVAALLALCVTVLVAVYATAPEASLLLLEEGFRDLNDSRWTHQEADCRKDAGQFSYVTADEENRLIADGVLHIYPNITSVHFRTKRESAKKCNPCLSWENSAGDCSPLLFSAKIQTKEPFQADRGRLEIRAKICCGGQIRFDIGLSSSQNNSSPEDVVENLRGSTGQNNSEIRVVFESTSSNKTVMTSAIEDAEFHTYEIEWDDEKVELNIDKKKVMEKSLEGEGEGEGEEENISKGTGKLDSGPISKGFYLTVGVGIGEKGFEEAVDDHSNSKRSLESSTEGGNRSFLELDHIRIYKILK